MDDHSVGRLRLHVRAEAAEATCARRDAETLTRRALERAGDILRRRHPDRVVLIRRLPLHISARAGRVASEATIECVARGISEWVEGKVRLSRRPDDGLVVYESRSAWLADALVARATGPREHAWHLARLGPPARLVRQLCTTDAWHSPSRTLAILDASGSLHGALRGLNRIELIRVAESIGAGDPRRNERRTPAAAVVASELATPPARGTVGRRVPVAWEGVDNEQIIQSIQERIGSATGGLPQSSPHRGPCPARADGTTLDAPGTDEEAPKPRDRHADEVAPAHDLPRSDFTPSPRNDGLYPEVSASSREPVPPARAADRDSSGDATLSTELGGLFYLLSLALELDVGETLWKACLPEGQALGESIHALVVDGWPDDPAPRVMGGLRGSRQPVSASAEQIRDAVPALFDAFVRACPRRGLASVPELHVRLTDTFGERALCVTAIGSPFVLYAAPAGSMNDCLAALEEVLKVCTGVEAGVWASPELIEIDRSGRLRPRAENLRGPALLLPLEGTAESSMLRAVTLGVLCQLFALRVKCERITSVAGLVDRYLARPAELHVDAEAIHVVMHADAVDMAVRRAGLDRDPGWVPWLKRTVKVRFRGGMESL